ncbi:MAG: hypothetical protein ACOYOK_01720 [Pseudobdellovibrionaceae bacterium]
MFNKKTENIVPNIWTAQENVIQFYKIVSACLGGIVLIQAGALLISYFRDPIVVVKNNSEIEFYPSARTKIAVGKNEISQFTKQFIAALYVWPEFNADALKKEVSTFIEEDLLEKLMAAQVQRYVKELKNKKMSQAVTSIEIEVLPDKVVAKFDRLLKIEGVPIVIPTELNISMIQGSSTRVNPMGIYISGIIEHEGTK